MRNLIEYLTITTISPIMTYDYITRAKLRDLWVCYNILLTRLRIITPSLNWFRPTSLTRREDFSFNPLDNWSHLTNPSCNWVGLLTRLGIVLFLYIVWCIRAAVDLIFTHAYERFWVNCVSRNQLLFNTRLCVSGFSCCSVKYLIQSVPRGRHGSRSR